MAEVPLAVTQPTARPVAVWTHFWQGLTVAFVAAAVLAQALWRNHPAAAILLMMGLAVLLTLCSEADAFVAASFRHALPLSAQLGFMVLGPMLDLKLTSMYLSFFRKKAFLMLVGLMVVLVFAAMMAVEMLAGRLGL